jgi:hypothetical protein
MWRVLSQLIRWTDVNVRAIEAYLLFLIVIYSWGYSYYFIRRLNTLCYFIVLWTTSSCSILFWIIYFVNFNWINPVGLEVPLYTLHLYHTCPFLVAILIGWIIKPEFSRVYRLNHVLLQCVLLFGYFLNMRLIYLKFDYFPYPFMNLLKQEEWIVLITLAYVISICIFEPMITKYLQYVGKIKSL